LESLRATTDPCTVLDWDNEFWGVRIARVEGDTLTTESAAHVDAWAERHGIDCLYFLARSDDAPTAHAAEQAGFRLMDVRIELERSSGGDSAADAVRASRPDDVAALRAIARVSHRGTRFYADPRFPRARCDDLYDIWIERSCAGWADVVLVAEHQARPAGYVSCHLDTASASGSIGLIAVAETARELGLGRMLVDGAVAWCAGRGARTVTVATQGRSVGALRLYERCGFRIESLRLWFHKWHER
jgi:dTDP-4-amino-4,6-dideoxy-D-galactose acyltransferase